MSAVPTGNTDNEAGVGTWNENVSTSLLSSYNGNSDIWIKTGGTGDAFLTGFGLSRFQTNPWNDTEYLTNNSEPSLVATASGSGDPHIVTITNHKYDLITKQYFNMFDNNNKNDRLTINASVEKSKYCIWKDKEYINKIFIKHNDNYCTISTGFRGSCVKLEQIKGNIQTNTEILKMNINSKRFCSECRFRSRVDEDCIKHEQTINHKIIPNVRNSMTVDIKTNENVYQIIITNVDNDNFNPCDVSVKIINNKCTNKYSGAFVKESLKYECDLENLDEQKLIN